jgi:hypothetical protein
MQFKKLHEIDLQDETSWRDAVFLTLDIDWACDEVLLDSIELIEKAGVRATFFATHATPLLLRIAENPLFELGLHPNFNELLRGTPQAGGMSAEEVVSSLASIIPGARSFRSHSLSWGDVISQAIRSAGITNVSNHLIPEQSRIILKPYADWYGLVHAPYFYQDSACFYFQQNTPIWDLATREGLKVFDFHPMHIYLNSESQERYERLRESVRKPDVLLKNRYEGEGARNSLLRLMELG